ncbi:MAG TPA: CinA family protein, partial [Pedobacter sp.]
KAILDFMEERGATLSVAESCTGGYLSHLITQHAGSSAVFLGGAVTYSNNLKIRLLSVPPETIEKSGAVSEETVKLMAGGSLINFKSDYSVAISGIAGPGGGTEDKPVGIVWVAVAGPKGVISKKYQFGSRRTQNIERAAINALTLLFHILKEDYS